MAAYGEDSSRSALTFMPPVMRHIVSLPDRSVTCTNAAAARSLYVSEAVPTTRRCGQVCLGAHSPSSTFLDSQKFMHSCWQGCGSRNCWWHTYSR